MLRVALREWTPARFRAASDVTKSLTPPLRTVLDNPVAPKFLSSRVPGVCVGLMTLILHCLVGVDIVFELRARPKATLFAGVPDEVLDGETSLSYCSDEEMPLSLARRLPRTAPFFGVSAAGVPA